ncbi:MAG: DNA primase DnaG [Candidatus Thorarchaeota archaeon]|jgi:DNA primase
MKGDFDESTAKYVIRAKIEIEGVVDKPDVVGAVFGQTEGLLGEDLDLRELQRTGRIGRIQIAIKSQRGISKGEIVIPVSLNKTATAILAAALETVDRVGPCLAKVTLLKVEDIRGAKRRKVVSRAISILKGWEEDIAPGTEEITGAVTKASKRAITKFGADKLPAGPELESSTEIIIVEGRADILNLLKCGINNTIAVEGTRIPKTITELTKKKKTVIAFLDGDRGGDLIFRELMQVARIDYVARAPQGKEVEELTRREVIKALQAQVPADRALALVKGVSTPAKGKRKQPRKARREEPPRRRERRAPRDRDDDRRKPPRRVRRPRVDLDSIGDSLLSKVEEIKESFKAALFDDKKKVLVECGVAELANTLESQETVYAVVFDGVVTQRLVDIAAKKKTKTIIGAAVADIEKKPITMRIFTYDDLEQ